MSHARTTQVCHTNTHYALLLQCYNYMLLDSEIKMFLIHTHVFVEENNLQNSNWQCTEELD